MACPSLLSEDDLRRFRTKPCRRHKAAGWESQCEFGDDRCQYSHCPDWPRRCPFYLSHHACIRYIPVPCPDVTFSNHPPPENAPQADGPKSSDLSMNVESNRCSRGGSCPFAHSMEEVFYHPLKYKIFPCNIYMTNGGCKSYYCPNYHGTAERRTHVLQRQYFLPFVTPMIQEIVGQLFSNVTCVSSIPKTAAIAAAGEVLSPTAQNADSSLSAAKRPQSSTSTDAGSQRCTPKQSNHLVSPPPRRMQAGSASIHQMLHHHGVNRLLLQAPQYPLTSDGLQSSALSNSSSTLTPAHQHQSVLSDAGGLLDGMFSPNPRSDISFASEMCHSFADPYVSLSPTNSPSQGGGAAEDFPWKVGFENRAAFPDLCSNNSNALLQLLNSATLAAHEVQMNGRSLPQLTTHAAAPAAVSPPSHSSPPIALPALTVTDTHGERRVAQILSGPIAADEDRTALAARMYNIATRMSTSQQNIGTAHIEYLQYHLSQFEKLLDTKGSTSRQRLNFSAV